ncbi:MAG: hypothetical protein LUG12_06275 [Erysipelotrichaceae bacterium]|nr:hypothetical protein [Erysipelotrichaceae bacterium]
MQKLLFKRTLRDFKKNFVRYFLLMFLIVLCMFMVVGIMSSASSVINKVNVVNEKNHVEDGQFSVFVPLNDSVIDEINDKGITIEEHFYLDISMNDDSTLRLMKDREYIDLIELSQGNMISGDHDIILDKVYASNHDYSIGDSIMIGDQTYTICGFGSVSDYDNVLENMGDMSSDMYFGIAFISDDAYESIKKDNIAIHSEEYVYSYLLNGYDSDDFKDYLYELTVNVDDIDDGYFQDMIEEKMADRNEIVDGIQELVDGSSDLSEAMDELNNGIGDLSEGIEAIQDALNELSSNSDTLSNASTTISQALTTMNEQLSLFETSYESLTQLSAYSSTFLENLKILNTYTQQLANATSYDTFINTYSIDTSSLSDESQTLLTYFESYLNSINQYTNQINNGTSQLVSSYTTMDTVIQDIPAQISTLTSSLTTFQEAFNTLTQEYNTFNEGLQTYTSSLDTISTAYNQISEGMDALSSGSDELSTYTSELSDAIVTLQDESNDLLDEYFSLEMSNLTSYVEAASNPRINASVDDLQQNHSICILAGILIIILLTYVISVFMVHSIDQESSMIGALYALGLSSQQLILSYTMLPVLLCFIGGLIGTAIGFSDLSMSIFAEETFTYYCVPDCNMQLNGWLIIYGVIVPPLILFVVSQIVLRKRLNQTALSLLRKEENIQHSRFTLKKLSFVSAFQIRQILREKRSIIALVAGMFISLLVLFISLDCYALCMNINTNTVNDTTYNYMYVYKYVPDTLPDNGSIAYIESLYAENLGYEIELSITGISDDNPYFPAITSTRKNELSISSSVSQKFGWKEGDTVILSDTVNDSVYQFTIKEVVEYNVGMMCFMDIDAMRSLYDQDDDYYNVVYSDEELDIDSNILYSTTTREDIEKSSEIFLDLMNGMIYSLAICSVLIFIIVMYQMLKVCIDRSANSLSLMKIFGYSDKEIRKLYLDGQFIIVAISAAILMPLSKFIMDACYPYLIANISCGIDLHFDFYLYILIYAGILLCYAVVRQVLILHIRKADVTAILKNRE